MALLVANGALFWRGPIDIFALPRATLIVAVTVVLAALSAAQLVRTGCLAVPRSPIVVLAALFVVVLGVVVVGSDYTMQAIIGPYTRYTGLAMYAAYAATLVFLVRVYDQESAQQLAWGCVAALALVAGYGLTQLAGADPLDWPQSEEIVRQFGSFNTNFSTLGNVDFSAAFVGITAPFAVWSALSTRHGPALRLASAVLLVAAIAYAVGTGAFQGPVTLVAGCSVVVAIWLVERRRPWHVLTRGARWTVGGAGAALVVTVLAVTPIVVPHAFEQLREGEERVQFWKTAVDIWLDDPLTGGGIGVFSREFTARRPTKHATEREFQSADAPHSAVLELLADGGLLVALPYVGMVGCTAWLLIRGLKRTRGETRALLAAFGGSWIAYQLQSMVSIDVPPLALLHWVAVGGIIVLSEPPRLWTRRLLPAALGTTRRDTRDRAQTSWRRPLAEGAIVAAGILTIWLASQPLRADLAAAGARDARGRGSFAESAERAEQATDLAGWVGSYWALRAGALDQLGDLAAASEAGERAARESPWNSTYALAVAGLAERQSDADEAIRWLAEAIRRDPDNPAVLEVAARFHLKQGSVVTARTMLEHAVDIDPRSAKHWSLLGQAHMSLGDDMSAAAAFARARQLDPDEKGAREELGRG